MTTKLKAKIMLAILKVAPMGASEHEFERMANDGNVPGIWRYYQNSLAKRADAGVSVVRTNEIALEALQPAMQAIYELPTSDGRAGRE
jgi:hypothetical protein